MPRQSPRTALFSWKIQKNIFEIWLTKKSFIKCIEILPPHLSEKIIVIVYWLPISLQEIEIYRYRLGLFKLSVIVIAVQKGLSPINLSVLNMVVGLRAKPITCYACKAVMERMLALLCKRGDRRLLWGATHANLCGVVLIPTAQKQLLLLWFQL